MLYQADAKEMRRETKRERERGIEHTTAGGGGGNENELGVS